MTGIVALLAWYRENPAWLVHCIRSLQKLPVDHLVAVDGAYALFPDAQARSSLEEYEAIHHACFETGIGLTLHTPAQTWAGNEIEKRSKLFQLGDQEQADWFLVVDTDTAIRDCPDDVRARLAATDRDVAQVMVNEPHPDPSVHNRPYPVPMLFRAIPGIRVAGNHFTYQTPDGRYLWGNAAVDDLEPRLDLTDHITVDHLTHYRDPDRKQAASAYYDDRDEQAAESFECGHATCEKTAKHALPVHWHPNTGGFVAEWVWACRDHREQLANKGRWQLSQHVGWDTAAGYYQRKLWLTSSDDLKVEHRAGPVPA